ncbi:uncharacterized protein LOC135494423 [Lineus longissimus]|uniref:uncharacterized protein LOC135494423 n=1 Tax=Lineus longissimus TaxID=88925 RepID=UPI002B4D0B93
MGQFSLVPMVNGVCPAGTRVHPLWKNLCQRELLIHLTHRIQGKCPPGTVSYAKRKGTCLIKSMEMFEKSAVITMRTTDMIRGRCPTGTTKFKHRKRTCIIKNYAAMLRNAEKLVYKVNNKCPKGYLEYKFMRSLCMLKHRFSMIHAKARR